MLTKETFCDIIQQALLNETFIDKANEVGLNLFDTEVYNYAMYLQSLIFKEFFIDEGIEIIEWWLYEYDRTEPGIWDKDNNVIPVYTAEELWDFLNDGYLK